MKQIGGLLMVLFVWSCADRCEDISGTWKVLSPYYNASFQIQDINGELKCAVLTYDDGTSRFDNRGKSPYYLANELKCEDGIYIDGVSGATALNKNSLTINKLSTDTLSVTSFIMNKPLKEYWIKIK